MLKVNEVIPKYPSWLVIWSCLPEYGYTYLPHPETLVTIAYELQRSLLASGRAGIKTSRPYPLPFLHMFPWQDLREIPQQEDFGYHMILAWPVPPPSIRESIFHAGPSIFKPTV